MILILWHLFAVLAPPWVLTYLAGFSVVHASVVDGVDGGEVLEDVVVGRQRRRRYRRAENQNFNIHVCCLGRFTGWYCRSCIFGWIEFNFGHGRHLYIIYLSSYLCLGLVRRTSRPRPQPYRHFHPSKFWEGHNLEISHYANILWHTIAAPAILNFDFPI